MNRFAKSMLLVLSALLSCGVLLAPACSFSDTRKHCSKAEPCALGQTCYRGFCVPADRDASAQREEAARDAASGDALTDAAPMSSGPGSSTDAALAENMSEPQPPAASGACVPAAERCNGRDDDCDGLTDEDADKECYPGNMPGCAMGSCRGTCALGKQACVDGSLQMCAGAQTPQPERCTDNGATALDENCDGRIDEGCTCSGGATRSCYMGPDKSAGVGKCVNGVQTCRDGQYGACEQSVLPAAESCANEGADDDCNGVQDDVRDRNAPCSAPGNQGACSAGSSQCVAGSAQLQCVPAKPAAEQCNGRDDDCNGMVDDGFDLQTDPQHCGSCDHACTGGMLCCAGKCAAPNDAGVCGSPGACPKCAAGEECCDGRCINTHGSDLNHCGGCNTVCASGERPGCCGGQCVDFTADTTCGRCDSACGLLSLGGLACKCGSLNGELQCVGVALGGLLQLCL